jgi:type I restriction enzyme S subunit
VTARWAIKRLEQLGTVLTGATPKTAQREHFGRHIPFIKPADFNPDGSLRYDGEGLSAAGLKQSRRVRASSVLMVCIGATIGKCGFCDREVSANQQINALLPFPGVSHKFVYYQMLTDEFQRSVLANAGQATLPIINKSRWSALTLKLPPRLADQLRVVAMLDEAFAGIDAAFARAEKNSHNAHRLFAGHLNAVFNQHAAAGPETKLGEVCDIFAAVVDPRQREYAPLLHIGAANIESQTGALLNLETARDEGLISSKYLFDESMVLYSKIRPYLMKVARPPFAGLCSADIYPLAPRPNLITRDYLFHLLLGQRFTDYAVQGSARAGMPKLNRQHLFDYTFALPPLSRQALLTANLDALHQETRRLASLYQRKLAALAALKKSLLHQAFGS